MAKTMREKSSIRGHRQLPLCVPKVNTRYLCITREVPCVLVVNLSLVFIRSVEAPAGFREFF